VSYEEEDTCVSYEEKDICLRATSQLVSYEEEDTCIYPPPHMTHLTRRSRPVYMHTCSQNRFPRHCAHTTLLLYARSLLRVI
jgi:hypothetical protein